MFWMLYDFFWVIPRHMNFIFQRFGALYSIFIGRLRKWNRQSFPKRWHFRRRGITQKKAYDIMFGYWQFSTWKCDFHVKIILGFRGNSAGRFGQSYNALGWWWANLWQALLAVPKQHNVCVCVCVRVCVFHLVRTMCIQRTTKNTSEIHQVTIFFKGETCIYLQCYFLFIHKKA